VLLDSNENKKIFLGFATHLNCSSDRVNPHCDVRASLFQQS